MIVRGHALCSEGAPFSKDLGRKYPYRGTSGVGHALCSCGALSPEELASGMARRRWHAQHKKEVADRG